MTDLLAGATAMGYAVAALLFLKFNRKTRDRLFAMFAAAFAVLAVNRCLYVLIPQERFSDTWFYLIRVLAYGLILVAIIDKNRTSRPR